MFILFSILAWSTVLGGSVALLTFSTLAIMMRIMPALAVKIGTLSIFKFAGASIFAQNAAVPNKLTAWIMTVGNGWVGPILMAVVAVLMLLVSIVEFVRLKKRQKIQKPFIKLNLVTTAVIFAILGLGITVVYAAALVLALIFLEFLLFDTEALNNYAEERNLISIYREERKFEREVNKEGKLIGSVDSETLAKLKAGNSNTLAQDENQKANDNLNPAAAMTTQSDNSVLSDSTSSSALPVKMNDIQGPVTDPENVQNKKYQKWYSQYKVLVEQLESYRKSCFDKKDSLKENQLQKLQSKFNERAEKINKIAKELKLGDEFMQSYIDIGGNTPESEGKTVESAMPTPNLQATSSMDHATTAFGGMSSTAVDPNIENLHDQLSRPSKSAPSAPSHNVTAAPMPSIGGDTGTNEFGVPETFVIPQTQTMGTKMDPNESKKMLQERMKLAIRMDFDMLPETDQPENATLYDMYQDMGVIVETKDAVAKAAPLKISAAPAPGGQPSFDTTVTAPPVAAFGLTEDTNQEVQAPEFAIPETFVIPQTQTTASSMDPNESKKMLQERMKYAIRMDWTQLPETDQVENTDIDDIYHDMGIIVETKGAVAKAAPLKPVAAPQPVSTPTPSAPTPPSFSAPTPSVPAAAPIPPTPQASASVAGDVQKISNIEDRMDRIEKMLEQLANGQSTNKSNLDNDQVAKIHQDFERITKQLEQIGETIGGPMSGQSLIGSLTRGYRYNSKK